MKISQTSREVIRIVVSLILIASLLVAMLLINKDLFLGSIELRPVHYQTLESMKLDMRDLLSSIFWVLVFVAGLLLSFLIYMRAATRALQEMNRHKRNEGSQP